MRDEPLSLKQTHLDEAHGHMNGYLVNGFATPDNDDSSEDSDDDMPLELPPSPKVKIEFILQTLLINKLILIIRIQYRLKSY